MPRKISIGTQDFKQLIAEDSFYIDKTLFIKEWWEEKDLSDTAKRALQQIKEKQYDADLIAKGIAKERIYKYGFAFRGKECLILRG